MKNRLILKSMLVWAGIIPLAIFIFTGNLWALVVLFIGCTPWLTAKAKNMI